MFLNIFFEYDLAEININIVINEKINDNLRKKFLNLLIIPPD
jgi:hypothetical protein